MVVVVVVGCWLLVVVVVVVVFLRCLLGFSGGFLDMAHRAIKDAKKKPYVLLFLLISRVFNDGFPC